MHATLLISAIHCFQSSAAVICLLAVRSAVSKIRRRFQIRAAPDMLFELPVSIPQYLSLLHIAENKLDRHVNIFPGFPQNGQGFNLIADILIFFPGGNYRQRFRHGEVPAYNALPKKPLAFGGASPRHACVV